MKTCLTVRTASLAIAMSLAGAVAGVAHAQDNGENAAAASEQQTSKISATKTNGSKNKDAANTVDETVEGTQADTESLTETVAEGLTAGDKDNTKDKHGNTAPTRWGTIVPFSASQGTVDPSYGDINAFYGDINAFWGTINPFYGDINAFWGDINPFYGNINAFWGDINAFYGNINAFDAAHLQSLGDFGKATGEQINQLESRFNTLSYDLLGNVIRNGTSAQIGADLAQLIALGENQFGATYTARTGQSFDALVAEIFARHGVNPSQHTTIESLTAEERAALYLDWNDTLMQYSGVDQVDHWMAAINWTPAVTQIQGAGHQTVIGIVDGSFDSDAELSGNIAWSGGGTTTVNGHGAAVASLIAAKHDGAGLLGIAPDVQIATYNPFSDDNSASWDSVATGIRSLLTAYVGGNDTGYVSVINLSLGESGSAFSQGLADVLARPSIAAWSDETLYVVAAGNEGISQSSDIHWDFRTDTSFILVGSVDPNQEISGFSNRPGSACLLDNGVCNAGNELYLRTVVAPGSLILASDGAGGVTRVSGTSFAAPLVSGAVSLLHDRWPWLARHTNETAQIIFESAQDLGAPGPDEVYGWGLLDVTASQSPLDFNNVNFTVHQPRGGGFKSWTTTASNLLSQGSIPAWWETDGVFLTGFENVGGTYRDFAVPFSSLNRGSSTNALGNGQQRLQDFVADRFANWLLSNGKDSNGDGVAGITQLRSNAAQTRGQWTVRYDAMQPRFVQDGAVRPVHNAATLTTPKGDMSFTIGHGQGALALNGGRFGIMSDHNPATGGVNPVLGLASGEFFAGATINPTAKTKLSVGYSMENRDWEDLDFVSDLDRELQRQLGAREAEAFTVALEQKISNRFSVDVQWTQLSEADALLGQQTGNPGLLGDGSKTDAMTLSANYDLGDGLSFDLSVTGGATKTNYDSNSETIQLLSTSGRALSTAGQFAVNKRGIMGSRDILRLSVGQPMTVERGELELTSDQVIDRQTGEIGQVTQSIGINTKRRYTGEIVYATPVTDNSELGVMGRYVSSGDQGDEGNFIVGMNFGLRF